MTIKNYFRINYFSAAGIIKFKCSKEISCSHTCPPTISQIDLEVNNVRAHLLVGGDLWWDPSNTTSGQYEVLAGSGKISIYAGSSGGVE